MCGPHTILPSHPSSLPQNTPYPNPSVSSNPLSTPSTSLGLLRPQTPPPRTTSAPCIPTSFPTKFRPTFPGPMPTHRRTPNSWSKNLMLSHQRTVSTACRARRFLRSSALLKGREETFEMQGNKPGYLMGVVSSCSRIHFAAGAIRGEWNGESQLSRTARGSWPPNCRSWTSRALMRSMLPESTI